MSRDTEIKTLEHEDSCVIIECMHNTASFTSLYSQNYHPLVSCLSGNSFLFLWAPDAGVALVKENCMLLVFYCIYVFACNQVTISSACFAFTLCMSKVPGPYFRAFYVQCQNNAEFFARTRGLLQSFVLGQVQTKSLCSLRILGLFKCDVRCRPCICVMVTLLLKPDCSLESR